MHLRATTLLLIFACKREPPPPPAQPQSCLDAQLAARKLNEFGDPDGTVYAGGTPLFDEKSGARTDRAKYIFARHPDIARACDGGP